MRYPQYIKDRAKELFLTMSAGKPLYTNERIAEILEDEMRSELAELRKAKKATSDRIWESVIRSWSSKTDQTGRTWVSYRQERLEAEWNRQFAKGGELKVLEGIHPDSIDLVDTESEFTLILFAIFRKVLPKLYTLLEKDLAKGRVSPETAWRIADSILQRRNDMAKTYGLDTSRAIDEDEQLFDSLSEEDKQEAIKRYPELKALDK